MESDEATPELRCQEGGSAALGKQACKADRHAPPPSPQYTSVTCKGSRKDKLTHQSAPPWDSVPVHIRTKLLRSCWQSAQAPSRPCLATLACQSNLARPSCPARTIMRGRSTAHATLAHPCTAPRRELLCVLGTACPSVMGGQGAQRTPQCLFAMQHSCCRRRVTTGHTGSRARGRSG